VGAWLWAMRGWPRRARGGERQAARALGAGAESAAARLGGGSWHRSGGSSVLARGLARGGAAAGAAAAAGPGGAAQGLAPGTRRCGQAREAAAGPDWRGGAQACEPARFEALGGPVHGRSRWAGARRRAGAGSGGSR
jgi:hypothetical protein